LLDLFEEIFWEKALSVVAKTWLNSRNFRRSFVWVLIFYSIVNLLKFWALRVTRPLSQGDPFWFCWLVGDPPPYAG
jgi:membrane-bound metal-dependent hydrolase YbcI (DUF457 family)